MQLGEHHARRGYALLVATRTGAQVSTEWEPLQAEMGMCSMCSMQDREAKRKQGRRQRRCPGVEEEQMYARIYAFWRLRSKPYRHRHRWKEEQGMYMMAGQMATHRTSTPHMGTDDTQ